MKNNNITNMPLVTVVIPTYNRSDLLSDAIDSVLNQTYKNIELIVVDDGSDDDTRDVVSKYGNKVCYHFQANEGNSSARNYGIHIARGEYIAFLDHDDIWYPKRLEEMIGFMERYKIYSAIMSEVEFVSMKCDTLSYTNYKKGFPSTGRALLYMLANLPGLFSNLIIRKSIVSEIGLLDEQMQAASDIDYFLRIAATHNFALYPKPLLKYRKTETSFSNNIFTKNRLNVIDKFKKLYPDYSLKYSIIIKNTIAKIHLSYADDLLFRKYIKEARIEILKSVRNHLTLKAMKLYFKTYLIQCVSLFYHDYKDRGIFIHPNMRG